MLYYLFILTVVTLALNILVSTHVFRDDRRLGYEKVAEIGLIWLVPIFGALTSICISYQNPARVREYEDIRKFWTASS